MAVITSGKTFANGEQLSADKLNQVITAATFASGAIDPSVMQIVGDAITIADGGVTAAKLSTDALELAYPVGSIYMNASDSTDPGTLFGFGTWATFGAGKVPVGIDSTDADFDVVGSGTNTNGTTGAKTHTLVKTEIPPHVHSYFMKGNYTGGSTQGGDAYNLGTANYSTNGGTNLGENGNGTGNASPHNNLQPYIVVYMWKRTA